MKTLDLMFQTMLAELGQRSFDAAFTTDFPMTGHFLTNVSKGLEFWYFSDGGRRRYVGRKDDPEITRRVEEFSALKDDYKARRKLVATLTREGGLTAPDKRSGDVIEALAAGGLFRLRAVMVGTVAYQCYSGVLGVRLPAASMMTGDVDLAQDFAVSHEVADTIPPVLETLQKIDPEFRAVPHMADKARVTAFQNREGYRVEFLTTHRASDEFTGKPSTMPALGGASAEPLRFLDFLIRDPIRSVMLHRGGVTVTIPAPERYAVHKLIVATRRRNEGVSVLKRDKDVRQAASLIEALTQTRRQQELSEVWVEAWGRGDAWREALKEGASLMPRDAQALLRAAVTEETGT